jgi:hypothetical protein
VPPKGQVEKNLGWIGGGKLFDGRKKFSKKVKKILKEEEKFI